jgi:DNA-binding transcriptional MocR family regulator
VGGFSEALGVALATPDRWSTPQPFGDRALLDRLGELFGAPEGRTHVTGGVRSFASAWAGRTRTAIVEQPSFSEIPEILAKAGPVRRESWERMAQAAAESAEPATVWLTTPARNPDGRSLDSDGLDVLEGLARAGHSVVVNQIYRWFEPAVPAPAGVWTVTSLAKLCGGGSRIGWAVSPTDDPTDVALRACAPATVWQRAWASFLSERVVAALRADCVEPSVDARAACVDRLAQLLGWELPGAGLSVVLACSRPAPLDSAAGGDSSSEAGELSRLAEAGILASPGAAFGMPVASIRLAFSGVDAAQAREAADRIAGLVEHRALSLQPLNGFTG